MPRGETSAVHRQILALFDAGAIGAMSDGQLLELFTSRRDDVAEFAFTALVKRHGPMVLGVCRRILRDSHDSADAFQATFMVLAHRADAVRVSDSLGRWLYGVSRRVALQARTSALRRSSREAPGAEKAAVLPPDREREELFAALDEEIARLPEKYRAVIVLCDLEGTNHVEVARQLGCPVGTVESRLSRGRELLRTRLTRRGLAPAALASGGMFMARSAMAALPTPLVESTVRAALQVAAGRGLTAGVVAASVAALTERVLKAMLMTRLKVGVFGLLAVGTLAVGVVALASSANRPPGEDQTDSPREPVRALEANRNPRAGKSGPKLIPVKVGDLLRIEVLEALPGRPLYGIRIVRPDGTISLGFYGDLYVAGLNRDEIKVKLVKHLLKYLPDEVLGLDTQDENGKWIRVDPVDTDRVFVEDHLYQQGDQERRLEALEEKMEQVLRTMRGLKVGRDAPARPPAPRAEEGQDPEPPPDAQPAPKPEAPVGAGSTQEDRLREMDRKLNRILQRLEGLPREPRD
jgi:RNA polymerase sigma factor (sigma-70 family)